MKASKVKIQTEIDDALKNFAGQIKRIPSGSAEGSRTGYVRWGAKYIVNRDNPDRAKKRLSKWRINEMRSGEKSGTKCKK